MDLTPNKEKYFFVLTYGCQMNENDSEKFAAQLAALGYQTAAQISEADLILINTCCVRESAEQKIRGKIGELKKFKQANPDLLIGLAGCMAQKEQAKLLKKFPHLDFLIGTHNIHQLGEVIKRREEEQKRVCLAPDSALETEAAFDLPSFSPQKDKISAWVPISYGCDNFCSYCIVPYVRGRERSRPMPDILAEIKKLGAEGRKEITLLGQNVNSYGKDFKNGLDFADLLRAAAEIDNIERIRYMTSHPRDMSAKIIDVVAANQKGNRRICEHFHLPLQAGSDTILKAMNRGYTTEYYRELIASLRRKIPGVSITTDLIVGFPGETEELFQETLDFVAEIGFDAAYTFLYSVRSGTPAAAFAGQVPQAVKKERLQKLAHVQNAASLALNKQLENSLQEVLVEGVSKGEKYTGRTRTNKIVLWDQTGQEERGRLAYVYITNAKTWTLEGQLREMRK
ncbi:MAG: tRNA (N6-isopentenyl adenosine(37)-C2)-methylthiotransferase MiaB [Sporomusaceae bacterium]|jgi:tRNA-2-methylthio-N6-dimethylallyladenosine synthase|nr:tRNA (N6-isopentenyl adenosine(37)-C2)-methylthiotransferase MiaB [Sporomusaceae bacterium]